MRESWLEVEQILYEIEQTPKLIPGFRIFDNFTLPGPGAVVLAAAIGHFLLSTFATQWPLSNNIDKIGIHSLFPSRSYIRIPILLPAGLSGFSFDPQASMS